MNLHNVDFNAVRKRNENIIRAEDEGVYGEAEKFAMALDPRNIYQAEILIYAFYAGYAQHGIDNTNKELNDIKKKLGVV